MSARERGAWRIAMIMAGGTGGHIFGAGRVPWHKASARLTSLRRRLACTENVTVGIEGSGAVNV